MPVSSQTSEVSYSGNASTVTPYAVTFRFDENSWLKVEVTPEDGTPALLVQGTDYAISGSGTAVTASITTTTAIPATSTVRIYRDTPDTQLQDYVYNSKFSSANVESALDKLTMGQQDQDRERGRLEGRALRLPNGETVEELSKLLRSGRYIGFDADGDLAMMTAAQILDASGGAPDGVGLPDGGSAGYILTKQSAADADATWREPAVLNVTDFGAVGDGVTDDTAAIQAALDAAGAEGSRSRVVYLPPGANYRITEELVLKNDSCEIRGGGQTSVIVVDGDAANGITGAYTSQDDNQFVFPHKWTLRDFVIEGPGSATSTGYGIYFARGGLVSANRVLVQDVIIRGFSRGFYGYYTVNTELNRLLIEDCPVSIWHNKNDTLIIRNCWLGYLAGSTCLYSEAPGTGTVLIDGGEMGNAAQLLDCAPNTGLYITINGPNWESFSGSHICTIRGVGQITAVNINAMVVLGNASAIPFYVAHAQGSAHVEALRFGGLNHTDAVEVVAEAERSVTLLAQGWKVKRDGNMRLSAAPPVLDQSVFANVRRANLTSATTTLVAGGTTDKTDGSLLMQTSTGSTDAVHARLLREVNARPAGAQGTNWDSPIKVLVTEANGGHPTSNHRFAIQLGRADVSTSYAALTVRGIGFERTSSSAVSLFAHDGSSLTSQSFSISASNNQINRWLLDYDGAGNLRLYLATGSGRFVFQGAITGGPTGNSGAFAGLLEASLRNNGATSGAYNYIHEASVWLG